MSTVEAYLDRLHEIRATKRGTPELSYRTALENLLNAVGRDLDPPVQATAELADTGSGRPDFGLIETKSGNLRGVVEVKPVADDVPERADGKQITRYWKHYGQVLVTNYRDFLLVVKQPDGEVRVEGRYPLAPDAESFWHGRPRELAKEHGEGLTDFLRGVFTRATFITRPQDLADDLARHAREARRRLFRQDIAALEPLKQAMEQALGLHFHDREGEDFLRSSLVQTLYYGLFSGWMLWRQDKHTSGTFDWKDASDYLALPLIGDLFEEIAKPRRLSDLGLREPLEWATTSLNRVAEDEFFARFDADHAITLFYEPFLQAFDPELRKELGVWYTPPEIVQYMVGRVDQLLRSELGIADGLADDQVYVLDPAAGTGSYLIEVAKCIHRTLTDQGHHHTLATARVKKALGSRIFGFEILPAPYVIAHLQLGILLRAFGTNLSKDERCEVYLTNALTGWEPPKGPKQKVMFPELEREAERASRVKRETPILVILGNPPYNRFAGVAEDEEADLIEPYKAGLYEKWGVRKQLLDDLYIRFFRLAEKRIAEVGGRGIVSYISNYSWLSGVSHPIMREHLLRSFDLICVDNLHGDRKKSERAPDGTTSETVFAVKGGSAGIQVGTAIATLVKSKLSTGLAKVQYRDFEEGPAEQRRLALLQSLTKPRKRRYERAAPRRTLRWVFVNGDLATPTNYETWPTLPHLFPVHYSGLNENRQGALIALDPSLLERRIRRYLNERASDDDVADDCPALLTDAARFDAKATRQFLLKSKAQFERTNLLRLAFRPFDDLWVYWMPRTKLLNEKRVDFREQVWPGNFFLSASQTARKGGFNSPTAVDKFGDLHLQDPWSQYFPLFVRVKGEFGGDRIDPNLHPPTLEALCAARKVDSFDAHHHWTKEAIQVAEGVFWHSLAVFWSPTYRRENEATLRQDWPRVPIPAKAAVLDASGGLGRTVADLLLPDKPVLGVTTGKLRPELRSLGVPTNVGDGPIDPATDLRVEAGYGFRGQKNAVMCGKGKALPRSDDRIGSLDVYINDRVYWANVPADVWAMTIGGYPVLKKWLSYREFKVLGRPLRQEEMTYVTEVIRRLKALLLLGDELDANYRACSAQTLQVTSPVQP